MDSERRSQRGGVAVRMSDQVAALDAVWAKKTD